MMQISIDGKQHTLHGDSADLNIPTFGEDWRHELSYDSWTNHAHDVYRFDLGGRYLYLHDDQGIVSATIEDVDIVDYLYGCEWDDNNPDECIAEFGLEPNLTEADETWDGECRVWVEPNYDPGMINAPTAKWAREEDQRGFPGDILIFEDYKAAAQYVDNYYNEPSGYDGIKACQMMAHGQYAADTLVICKA